MLKSGDSIALLLDSAPRTWTSQEDIHLHLCESLRNRGVKLTLVFADPIDETLARRFQECGAAVEFVNYRRGAAYYLNQLKAITARHQISLFHICFFDYFSAVPWLARLTGTKRIIYEQLNSGVLTANSWKKDLIRMRGALATQPATHIIAISAFVKEQLVNCGVDSKKISVRHLGVDTDRFAPDKSARAEWIARYEIQPDELIISTVSVLRRFKNAETIIRACALLAERSIRFRLIVGGDGESLGELKELANELGIANRTHWLGYLPDPRNLLQASDIFLLASVGEAFGLVLTEAMACGVPIVGSRHGSLPEVVADGQTGVLANPFDPSSFADGIETLARNCEQRKKMGELAIKHVRDNFTLARTSAATLNIYETV